MQMLHQEVEIYKYFVVSTIIIKLYGKYQLIFPTNSYLSWEKEKDLQEGCLVSAAVQSVHPPALQCPQALNINTCTRAPVQCRALYPTDSHAVKNEFVTKE